MHFVHVEYLPVEVYTMSVCYSGNITLLRARQLAQLVAPLICNFLSSFRAELVGHRKAIAPGKGLAGVDEHSAHGEIAVVAFVRRQPWVEVGGPGFENLNRLR